MQRGDEWETLLDRVCPWKRRVAVCAFLVLSLSTFQPIILQGERALSVIILKPTQPLMLSHASSLMILIPTEFFSITWSCWFRYFTKNSMFALPIIKCLCKLNDDMMEKCIYSQCWRIIYSMVEVQIFRGVIFHTNCSNQYFKEKKNSDRLVTYKTHDQSIWLCYFTRLYSNFTFTQPPDFHTLKASLYTSRLKLQLSSQNKWATQNILSLTNPAYSLAKHLHRLLA